MPYANILFDLWSILENITLVTIAIFILASVNLVLADRK